MVGTVVFPTLRATVWCPGCWPGPSGWQGPGSRRWSWTRRAGRVLVLPNPANGNRAVPLICCRSGHSVAAA
jgi:hypothetical protein